MDLSSKHGQITSVVSGVQTSDIIVRNDQSDGDIKIYVNDGGVDTLAMTIDGATAEVSLAKDLSLSEDLELADGKKLLLGTGLDGEIYSSSDNLIIANVTADKDIIFSVNDGSVQTTVLTLNADVPSIDCAAPLVVSPTATTLIDVSGATATNILKLADGQGAVVGSMTAKSPENDAEAGFIRILIGATTYEIPFYAVA